MAGEFLTVTAGAPGLRTLANRAVRVDASAYARFQRLEGDAIDVFVTTPFNVVASRRIRGAVSRDGAVVSASRLAQELQRVESSEPTAQQLDLGTPMDPSWPGALPPASGFTLLDEIPVDVAARLSQQGQDLARQFSGPLGPPRSLLDQTVLTVKGGDKAAEVPMRMIFACSSLGLIPGWSAPMDVPRFLRVSTVGRWTRLDAPFGSVYHSTKLSLF